MTRPIYRPHPERAGDQRDLRLQRIEQTKSAQSGTTLALLGDVSIDNPADGDVLTYDATQGLWIASSPDVARWGSSGGAPVVAVSPAYRILTDGTLFEFGIDATVAGSGTTTVVLYYAAAAGTGVIVATANLVAARQVTVPVGPQAVAADDQLWVSTTAADATASGVAAYARMS